MPSLETLSFVPDLAGPQFSKAASAYFIAFMTYKGLGAIPDVRRDGDFTNANACGQAVPEYPFAKDGDPNASIVRQRYMQDAAYFKPLQLGSILPSDNRLLLIGEENFRDEGQRVVTWDRTYATVPAPHDEWGGFSYGFQYFPISGGQLTLAELPFTVTSRVRCEYFLISQIAQYPPFLAPRAVQVANLLTKRGKGNLSRDGSFVVSTDKEIIAEDSDVGCWKYPIHYRKTRWITGPTKEFWGNSVVLPITAL